MVKSAIWAVLTLALLQACNIKKETVSPLRFNYSPEEIANLCTSGQAQLKEDVDRIAKIPLDQANFKTAVLSLEKAVTTFDNGISVALFLKHVSPEKSVREASDKCENEVNALLVDLFIREDLYKVVKAAREKKEELGEQEAHLLDEYLVEFKRNGLELPPDQRKIYADKKKKLVLLESEFAKRLNEWEDFLEVADAELEGMPASFVEKLTKLPSGKYKLTLDYPTYFSFIENAKLAAARKKLEFKFENRGGEDNRKLLEQALTLRHELARMLGYANHAAFVLERRMAKRPEDVMKFLDNLGKKLKIKGKQDLDALLALKKLEEPGSKAIYSYDWRYYENQLKKKKHQIDQEEIKKYFPLEVVVNGMFDIYQTLLNVKFVKEKNPAVWHPSVELYRVVQGDKTVAYFYMDLFPREGKYNHAAAFTLTTGYELQDGYYSPSSSIVANFHPPETGKPSLLQHSEVETLFHEFGHIMHQVLTRAKYGKFSGTRVKTDFVEAPSQMLENWVWKKETLKKLSGHYLDATMQLPDELIDKLVAAKLANSGIRYLRQLSFATLDMQYHTAEKVDSMEIYKKAMKDIMLIPIQEGTKPQASFGHLMGGYDSGYYGYLWSEVYAEDMFTRFEKEGYLNPRTGADYRKWILERGGEIEPFELIKGFLGREPNENAFLKNLGLDDAFFLTNKIKIKKAGAVKKIPRE